MFLLYSPNVPGVMFIQGGKFISESRVINLTEMNTDFENGISIIWSLFQFRFLIKINVYEPMFSMKCMEVIQWSGLWITK